MTTDKAIEILTLSAISDDPISEGDLQDAKLLGLEALKFWKRLTNAAGDGFTYLLPGEDSE